jgi:ABC-type Fe3+-hydroxamate transport system substrate-binding protein
MNKRLYIGIFIIVLMAIASVSVFALHNNSSADSSSPSSVSSSPAQSNSNSASKNQSQTTGQPITVTGTIECLPPKNTNGLQATSCAIGLKQDNGTSYAITSQDPTTVGSLPTGQRVQVSGTLSQQSSQYDIEGIVNVTAVQKL